MRPATFIALARLPDTLLVLMMPPLSLEIAGQGLTAISWLQVTGWLNCQYHPHNEHRTVIMTDCSTKADCHCSAHKLRAVSARKCNQLDILIVAKQDPQRKTVHAMHNSHNNAQCGQQYKGEPSPFDPLVDEVGLTLIACACRTTRG